MFSVRDKLHSHRQKWTKLPERMPGVESSESTLNYRPRGGGNISRPRKCWSEA